MPHQVTAHEIAPVVLDLSLPDAQLRATARAALADTLSPMPALVNHGCEKACVALAEKMRHSAAAAALPPGTSQQAIETDEAVPLWFEETDIPYHEMWEDDRLWIPHLLAGRCFSGRYVFDEDRMVDAVLHTGSSAPEGPAPI